jgi:LacI family transcriptional regulator
VREKRTTIVDIANAVGVTDGTVSRALAGDPRVHPETRDRILTAARRLDYRPNLTARAVKRGRTHNVGVFCGGGSWMLYNAYFGRLLAGLAQAAARDASRLVFYLPTFEEGRDPNPEEVTVRLTGLEDLQDGRVDGAIVVSGRVPSAEEQKQLRELDLPVLLVGNNAKIRGLFQLLSGAYERTRLACERLHQEGRRRVAMIGLAEGSDFDAECVRALKDSVSSAGEKYDATLFTTLTHWDLDDPANLEPALRRVLRADPDALILCDAHQALVAEPLLTMFGRNIPLVSFSPMPAGGRARSNAIRLVECDLIAEGQRAYQLFRDAQQSRRPRVEVMQWHWPSD